ncbi:Mitogen-activated protein kinase kinase kinase 19 [Stylophora pistillata]|uniref:Mitogen-activated protein kinase kinase kinase 19 n=1 Tax=Stylophora pistillata TaxID=50429 RepID=A0A2B4SAB3_STYPI|nr:Mitogen-activated protein kinase kinase kinase 19 [Stylophora pistillata]
MTKGGFSCQSSRARGSKDCMRHYYDITSRLFSNGRADDYLSELFLNAAKNGDIERVQNFLARTSRNASVNVDVKDREEGFTAVMLAAMNKHEKVVSLLLNYGADITLHNNKGQTVLDIATDSMRPLLLGSVARQGYSSRHILQAAWQGNFQLVKKLLSSKARLDVNCKNADGLTPLLLVTRDINLFEKIEKAVLENSYHPVDVVKELIAHNADCGARDSEGKRPLHFAAHGKGSHAQGVVNILIQEGASEIEDNQPILLALIEGGANVNAKGHVGKTPLHIAASHGFELVSDTLLHHGADVTITDDNGLSAVDVAKGKRVQQALKEAWVGQTQGSKYHSHRVYSAPAPPQNEQESVPSKLETTEQKKGNLLSADSFSRVNTAPSQRKERKLKKKPQSFSEEISLPKERSSHPVSNKPSDVRMPRIPSAQKPELSLTFRSSSELVGRGKPRRQELTAPGLKDARSSEALPGLSVLNIELRNVRNLRDAKPMLRKRKTSIQSPVPPNYRLHHRLSSPVLSYQRKLSPPGTPRNEARIRSSSESLVPSSRLAVPSRVPPLGGKRALTPELRSITTSEMTKENIAFTPEIIDLDLLTKQGRRNEKSSSLFLSEVREVTPPPPSPRIVSRNSPEDIQLESDTTKQDSESVMTRTFESVPRPSFWIPVDGSTMEKNDPTSVQTVEESSSNGTKFYIDLSNLEALATGQCSLCGDSLPETTKSKGDTISSNTEREICKSCQPRRRSSEDVFWIPFTDKRKASALKILNGMENRLRSDPSIEKERKNSGDEIVEQSNGEPHPQSELSEVNSSVVEGGDSKALVLTKPALPFSPNMTGYDVSCVCDNNTGLCSCTIVKKDVSSSPSTDNTINRVSGATGVVKTVGETSSLLESTLVARPTNEYASSRRAPTYSKSTSSVRKETELFLKSFSENDVSNHSLVEDTVKTTLKNIEENENHLVDAHQNVSGQIAKQPFVQEIQPDDSRDGTISNAPIEPSPPKHAWATPRMEEPGTSSVKITNPFPSPVPPVDKSAVHPPIGPVDDNRMGNKKHTLGKKGKKCGGKTAATCKPKSRTKNKVPEQNVKGSKKKGKTKKKSDIKMVTVQQREAREELGLRTISQGGLDVAEESMDNLCTFRPFGMFKGIHTILTPIPESPRSALSTPRTTEGTEQVGAPPKGPEEESREAQEGSNKGPDVVVLGNEKDSEGMTEEGEFDVVDGGMFSSLIGMCVPRLKLGKSDVVSDSGSDAESTEALVTQPQGGGVTEQQLDSTEEGIARDRENVMGVDEVGAKHQVVQDEADDAMEAIIKRELSLEDKRESGRTNPMDQASVLHNQTTKNCSSDEIFRAKSNSSQVNTGEESLLSYRCSRDFSSEILDESDLPSEERTSSEASSFSEQYSDTDSSYNSLGSASPRPLSPASSLNSSDTYFSSPRSSSGPETPTPEREIRSENSVEIDYYEQMARGKSSISSSSNSSSTIRTRSNISLGSLGNVSQGSMGSFAASVAENVVRSRLSASSRTQSSTSCEEEIVWKKGNILGKGAFGTVWCGLTNTGEMIAVKQVELNNSNFDEAEKQYEKLQEEVSLLKSLQHKNIVKYIGTCLDGGVVNIFMEFVPGGSIASILARFGCLDEPVFSRYTKQLLSGVSYLHSNNVIHRDIKGGNILIMASGVLKLIDFGCAKRLYMNLSMSRSNILRSMKGTPYWMAPEVIRETGHGRKSDIWSVGCTVFEMATGKPPWSDMPPMAAIFAIGSGSLTVPQLSEDFSSAARDFVSKCLTRDPDWRPSADELLQHHFLTDTS